MKSILLSILFVASLATANAAITIDPVSRTFEKEGGGAAYGLQGVALRRADGRSEAQRPESRLAPANCGSGEHVGRRPLHRAARRW